MPDHILTDDDCARIVAASVHPDRVLGGIEGHDGGAADVLLTTVEGIVAERTRVLADEIEDYRQGTVGALRRAEAAEAERDRLRGGIGAIEEALTYASVTRGDLWHIVTDLRKLLDGEAS